MGSMQTWSVVYCKVLRVGVRFCAVVSIDPTRRATGVGFAPTALDEWHRRAAPEVQARLKETFREQEPR